MTYEILFSDSSLQQLKSLDRGAQQRILAALERIRTNPWRYVKKLVDDPGYRLRVGDYRVILDIDGRRLLILVIKIGHRKNVYV